MSFVEAEARNEDGSLVAKAIATVRVRHKGGKHELEPVRRTESRGRRRGRPPRRATSSPEAAASPRAAAGTGSSAAGSCSSRQPGMWIGICVWLVGGHPASWPSSRSSARSRSMCSARCSPRGVAARLQALDEGGELEFGHLFAGFRDKLGTLIGGRRALIFAASIVIVLVVMLVIGFGVFAALSGSGGDPSAGARWPSLMGMLLAVLIIACAAAAGDDGSLVRARAGGASTIVARSTR